jgi:membrane-bound lytic murein transglycosylase D
MRTLDTRLRIFVLLIIGIAFFAGCAEKAPSTYYVHLTPDREMEQHLGAAGEALKDFEVEMAEEAIAKSKARLRHLVMAGYSKRVTHHYGRRLAQIEAGIIEIRKSGVPVRVEFSGGYDPEVMDPVDEKAKLGDLRLRLQMAPYHRRVEVNHLLLYYTRGPGRKQYEIYLRRLAPYKGHILRVFRNHGLPEELICVAMIESAGDPTRVSHAGAAGMWQFIPQTARNHGLIVTDAVDQRFDPILETYAAARYYKFLMKMFDRDVEASLASYNCGEGYIKQVLAEPGVRSVWQLPYHGKDGETDQPSIPRETYDYVARWYAAAIIYQNLEDYGFEFPVTPEDPFIRVYVTGETDTALLAQDLMISEQTLTGLNPSLKGGKTPKLERIAVRLPPDSPATYAQRLRKGKRYRITFVYRHKVTAYQTLRTVSKAYGVSAIRIADVNDLGEQNLLEAGTIIRIPTLAGNEKAKVAAKENVRYWRTFKDTLWDK